MAWRYRPGIPVEQQLQDLEKEIGIDNLQGVNVDEQNSFLYLFTETKKFRITMTEV